MENVLSEDESVYRALNPLLDFTLNSGNTAFIADILVIPGDCGPNFIEVFLSNSADKWNFVKEFKCNRDPE